MTAHSLGYASAMMHQEGGRLVVCVCVFFLLLSVCLEKPYQRVTTERVVFLRNLLRVSGKSLRNFSEVSWEFLAIGSHSELSWIFCGNLLGNRKFQYSYYGNSQYRPVGMLSAILHAFLTRFDYCSVWSPTNGLLLIVHRQRHVSLKCLRRGGS